MKMSSKLLEKYHEYIIEPDMRDDLQILFARKHCHNTFAECLKYNDIITEGLTSSYETDKLSKQLQKIFTDRYKELTSFIGCDIGFFINSKNKQLLTLDFEIKNYTIDDKTILEQILNLYGYAIAQHETNSNITYFSTEPKYPVDFTQVLKNNNIKRLYHITHISNLKKINRIGLVAKDTETSFYHPNDRIYLLALKNTNNIKSFKISLAKNKFRDANKYKEFVTISTPFNPTFKYYVDQYTTVIEDNTTFISVFILQNVPSTDLILENI